MYISDNKPVLRLLPYIKDKINIFTKAIRVYKIDFYLLKLIATKVWWNHWCLSKGMNMRLQDLSDLIKCFNKKNFHRFLAIYIDSFGILIILKNFAIIFYMFFIFYGIVVNGHLF